jgi:hypothetical protein
VPLESKVIENLKNEGVGLPNINGLELIVRRNYAFYERQDSRALERPPDKPV